MATIKLIEGIYQDLFNKMVIRPEWKTQALQLEAQLFAKRRVYQAACDKVNAKMPWYFVGILDVMEASGTASRHLHNGDSLNRRTVNDPAGRPLKDPMNGKGKPYTFLESAIDALTLKGCHVQTSWSLELMLSRFERYNGLGYAKMGIYTPYLWSGTTYYSKGKFVGDHNYDPNTVSKQLGAAVLLRYVTDRTTGSSESAKG